MDNSRLISDIDMILNSNSVADLFDIQIYISISEPNWFPSPIDGSRWYARMICWSIINHGSTISHDKYALVAGELDIDEMETSLSKRYANASVIIDDNIDVSDYLD